MLEHELQIATSLARLAGETILKHYEAGFETEYKIAEDDFNEPVTIADRESSRIIVAGLEAAFPDDGILSEEEADDAAVRLQKDRVWIIDPIDGTAGFINHDGDFAVQIGLAEQGRAMLGVVYLPLPNIMRCAVAGQGSYVSTANGDAVRVTTSSSTEISKMTLALSRNHPSPRMRRIVEHFGFASTVKRGSVGLKVGLITDRSCDIYIHPSPRTKLWDTCAPEIILTEAGGRLTDLFGLDLRYDTRDLHNRNGLVATNGSSHENVLKRLQPLLREFGRIPHQAAS
jgi:3'(2'), 5'-bisphosphate nucleotidase